MSQNQAAWLDAPGKQLRVGVADMPKVGPGKVLVRTRAVAINPVDHKIQDNGLWKPSFPTPLGFDLAGEVIEVGEDVEHVRKGDRIAAWAMGDAFQLYYAADMNVAGILPENISYEEGAVLPVAFMTAVVGLSSKRPDGLGLPLPRLQPESNGKIIVVWGGSSSVGAMTIQLAVAGGTTVIAVASARNFDFCKDAGAAEVFDYGSSSVIEDVVKAVKDSGLEFAGAYDAISVAESLERVDKIVDALGGGISIVVIPDTPASQIASVKRVPIRGAGLVPLPAWTHFFTEALRQGKLKPLPRPYVIGSDLDSCQKGLDYLRKGVSAQKVVVNLSP